MQKIFSNEPDECLIYLKMARGFIYKLDSEELDTFIHQKIKLELLKSLYWKQKQNYQKAYNVGNDMNSILYNKLQDTNLIFTNAKILTYFSFFALKINNISHAYQYSIMLNALFESILTKLHSEYLDELLTEIIIWVNCQRYTDKNRIMFYEYIMIMFLLQAICLNEFKEYNKAEGLSKKALKILDKLLSNEQLKSIVKTIYRIIRKNLEIKEPTERDYAINILEGASEEGNEKEKSQIEREKKKELVQKKKLQTSLSSKSQIHEPKFY